MSVQTLVSLLIPGCERASWLGCAGKFFGKGAMESWTNLWAA